MNNLPGTAGRLSSSLIIKAFALNSFDLSATLFNIPSTPGKILSVVTKFERKQDREVYRRYELGTNAFEPRDLIPQAVTTTLTLERIVLYKEDILEAFGLSFSGSLVEQFLPFLIQEVQVAPLNTDGTPTAPTQIFEYTDCWFATNPMTYDAMNADQIMLQNVDIMCGKVTSLPSATFQNGVINAALNSSGLTAAGASLVNSTLGSVQQLIKQNIPLQ